MPRKFRAIRYTIQCSRNVLVLFPNCNWYAQKATIYRSLKIIISILILHVTTQRLPTTDITVHTESGESFKAQVIFTNPIPDCALLKLSMPVHHSHPLITASKSPDAKSPPDKVYSSCFKEHPQAIEGRSVTIIGYGCQDPYTLGYHSPLLTRGCVIKAVCSDGGRVVMLVTTAVLLPGMSGGLVVDTVTGEPLGMAVSNSK